MIAKTLVFIDGQKMAIFSFAITKANAKIHPK